MSNKLLLSWNDVEHGVITIARSMQLDGWKPDLVIGVDRGGLPVSTMLSHYLNVPHQSVKVSLRNNPDTESVLWAPEEVIAGAKILLVDNVNDSGSTQAWLKADWAASVAGIEVDFVGKFWHNSVRWASLVENESSKEYSDYYSIAINKVEHDVCIDFPWESFWSRST
jgi:hypoxanthine phosphoribosyltransferase